MNVLTTVSSFLVQHSFNSEVAFLSWRLWLGHSAFCVWCQLHFFLSQVMILPRKLMKITCSNFSLLNMTFIFSFSLLHTRMYAFYLFISNYILWIKIPYYIHLKYLVHFYLLILKFNMISHHDCDVIFKSARILPLH
jgi:hypothetical protein